MFIFIPRSYLNSLRCFSLGFHSLQIKVDWLVDWWSINSLPLCQALHQSKADFAELGERPGFPCRKPARTFCTAPQQRLPLVKPARDTPEGPVQVRWYQGWSTNEEINVFALAAWVWIRRLSLLSVGVCTLVYQQVTTAYSLLSSSNLRSKSCN